MAGLALLLVVGLALIIVACAVPPGNWTLLIGIAFFTFAPFPAILMMAVAARDPFNNDATQRSLVDFGIFASGAMVCSGAASAIVFYHINWPTTGNDLWRPIVAMFGGVLIFLSLAVFGWYFILRKKDDDYY